MGVMPIYQISTLGQSQKVFNIKLIVTHRGSQVRFCILPDMLKNAPMLTYDKKSKQPRGLGRGAYRGRGRGRGMPGGRGMNMGGGGGGYGGGGHHGGPGHRLGVVLLYICFLHRGVKIFILLGSKLDTLSHYLDNASRFEPNW